jgi:hypothetical protein
MFNTSFTHNLIRIVWDFDHIVTIIKTLAWGYAPGLRLGGVFGRSNPA